MLLDREGIITIAILFGIFGGLVGGPILSLADYYSPPERRFWTFIIPEFIGFGCLILMVVSGKSKRKNIHNMKVIRYKLHTDIGPLKRFKIHRHLAR